METKLNVFPRENNQYLLFENDAEQDPLRLDVFFDDGPFGLLLLDRYFQVIKSNKKFLQLADCSLPQLVGRPVFDLLEEENALSLRSVLQHEHTLDRPLLTHLSFILADQRTFMTEGYIRRYTNQIGEYNFCILLFETDFCPERQMVEARNEIYQTIVETQEEERKNIGSALHDSVAQLLYGMRLNLQHFVIEHGNGERLMPVKKMLNEVIHTIRNLSMDLFPSVIDEFGLGLAIKSMADRLSFPGFKVVTIFPESCEQMPQRMKLPVYRIVQELLNNCMKHAMANHVSIRVTCGKNREIRIVVADNGRGFSQSADKCIEDGTGLRNIRSRIKLYDGEMRISDNNPGTKVTVRLLCKG